MNDILSFFVPGKPVPFTRVLRGSTQARAERYRAYRQAVGYAAKEAGAEVLSGPVGISIQIFDGQKRRYDADNVLKGIMDALNGICYLDDRQVVQGSFAVYDDKYGPEGVTVIIAGVLNGEQEAA